MLTRPRFTVTLLVAASTLVIAAPALAAPGDVRRTALTGDAVDSSPAVEKGTVHVGSDDGKVYAIAAATGEGSHPRD